MGVISKRVDALDGVAIFAFAALAIVVVGFLAIQFTAFSRSRYGIRLSHSEIELWHCSAAFHDAVERQRSGK